MKKTFVLLGLVLSLLLMNTTLNVNAEERQPNNEEHLIHMGDILTDAIVKQFPEKFQQ